MKNNKIYLNLSLDILQDDIQDLENWSVQNDDLALEEIDSFRDKYYELKATITEKFALKGGEIK